MEPARIPLIDENAASKDTPKNNSAINSSVNAAGKTLGTPTFLV
jgi:hypothetical protein